MPPLIPIGVVRDEGEDWWVRQGAARPAGKEGRHLVPKQVLPTLSRLQEVWLLGKGESHRQRVKWGQQFAPQAYSGGGTPKEVTGLSVRRKTATCISVHGVRGGEGAGVLGRRDTEKATCTYMCILIIRMSFIYYY